MIAHWDDVESGRAEAGHIGGLWTDLGSARRARRRSASTGSGSTRASGRRRSTADGGGGDLLRARRLGRLPARRRAPSRSRAGDCIVHRPRRGAHAPRRRRRARRARVRDARPRRRLRICRGRGVVLARRHAGSRRRRRASRGRARPPRASRSCRSSVRAPRRSSTSTRSTAATREGGSWRPLARDAGADLTGLNWGRLNAGPRGRAAALPLRGRGALRRARRRGHARALADAAARPRRGRVRGAAAPRGRRDLAARPSGIAHGFRAGAGRDDVPRVRHARARTTSATTRARTRSTSAGSA